MPFSVERCLAAISRSTDFVGRQRAHAVDGLGRDADELATLERGHGLVDRARVAGAEISRRHAARRREISTTRGRPARSSCTADVQPSPSARSCVRDRVRLVRADLEQRDARLPQSVAAAGRSASGRDRARRRRRRAPRPARSWPRPGASGPCQWGCRAGWPAAGRRAASNAAPSVRSAVRELDRVRDTVDDGVLDGERERIRRYVGGTERTSARSRAAGSRPPARRDRAPARADVPHPQRLIRLRAARRSACGPCGREPARRASLSPAAESVRAHRR